MIAKAGLGLIGLGAVGVGGVALAKPAWFGISNEMPTFKTLASSTTLSGKWVNDFIIYFVDSTGNDSWFDWVFKNRYKREDGNKTEFNDINGGKGANKSLSNACKKAYEAVGSNVKATSGETTTDSDFFEDNIWKYCSVGGTRLKTVKEAGQENNYGSNLGSKNKDTLLAAEYTDNDWAWHIKQKKFLSDAVPTEEGVFKKFHQENQQHKDEEKGLRLRDECKKRYNEEATTSSGGTNTATTLTEAALKKYCSLKETSA